MTPDLQPIYESILEGNMKSAPFTAAFAEAIGADGYAADASQAATLAKRLVG